MSINIQAEVRDEYLYLNCQGRYTVDAMLKVYENALKMAEAKHLKAVLIDISSIGGDSPTTIERFQLGSHVARLQMETRRIKIAVVGVEPMIDSEKFGETVAINRGAIGRVFTDLEGAIDWLKRDLDRWEACE